MKQFLKDIVKKTLFILHIDITKNQQYDRYTLNILKSVLDKNSNCIDIGCHKGEFLKPMIRLAPEGHHYAFEPIPAMYEHLKKSFSKFSCEIFQLALTDHQGQEQFNHVVNAPAYSGLKQRRYDIKTPDIKVFEVKADTLDHIIPASKKIGLIKIDVEGGEFAVLRGAKNTIIKNKPFIIFECGIGASDFYGTKPEELYEFLNSTCALKVGLLKAFLRNENALSKESFCKIFYENSDYYFIAYP